MAGDGRFTVNDGRHHGPHERLLTPVELEVVKNAASKGVIHNAGFARKLGIGTTLWQTLRLHRQTEAIAEAIATGVSILHDAVVVGMVDDALNCQDARVRQEAREFLLERRFGYTRTQSAVTVNVDGGNGGPSLTIIEEQIDENRLRAMAETLALRPPTVDSMLDADMARLETVGSKSRPLEPQHPLVRQVPWESCDVWDAGGGKDSTTHHIRRDETDLTRGG